MLLTALGSFGCGGDDSNPSGSTGSNTGGGGGAAPGTGGATETGGPTGGGGGDTGGGGGSGPDDRIDPIAEGHDWTYDVTELGTFPLCPSGKHTGKTGAASQVDGKTAFSVTSLCANADPSFYSIDGDVVQVDYMGTWILALDAPVEEGHEWSNGSSTFTWHDAGSVTVPAGKFNHCWKATQNVSYEAYTIFCRGVGPIHWYSKDLSGNGFDAVLTSKSF